MSMGLRAEAEHKLDGFYYDFFIPTLGFIIEVDSRRYHSSKRKKIKDYIKTKVAEDRGYKLARIRAGYHVADDARRAILKRIDSLG